MCFFIVSGFLMGLILDGKYAGHIKEFYINRVLRIYPPYLVALAFSVFIFVVFPNAHHGPQTVYIRALEAGGWTTILVGGIANLTLLGINLTRLMSVTEPNYVLLFPNFLYPGQGFGAHNLLFVPQGWTLSLELYFYLLAPFAARFKTPLLVLVTILAFWWIGPIDETVRANGWSVSLGAWFPYVLRYFLLGMCAYRGAKMLRSWGNGTEWLRWFGLASFVAAIALITRGLWLLQTFDALEVDHLLYVFAALLPGAFLFAQTFRWDAALGEYSYPVYVFHYMFSTSADKWVPVDQMFWPTFALVVTVSTLYIHLIDRRIMAYRASLLKRSTAHPERPTTLQTLPHSG